MKPILAALVLVPLMATAALAQEPTADAKEGKFYIDGGVGFGVASMATPVSNTRTGFDSVPLFAFGLAAEYGITEQIGVFTKLGLDLSFGDDPGLLGFGMTFDGAYKFVEKKGDVPAVSGYVGLGFVHLSLDPKGPGSDSSTDMVVEFGVQADFGSTETLSFQPFIQIQLVGGSRPFGGYNSVLQVGAGAKVLYKLADNLYLEPAITFIGGNFQDQVLFSIGVQLRL